MKLKLIAVLVLATGLVSASAQAQTQTLAQERPLGPGVEGAEELAREAVQRLLQALELLLLSIPQYEAPVLNDNGDIVIRRRRPGPKADPEREPPDDPDRPAEEMEPTETNI
jgi:hypothetical protein